MLATVRHFLVLGFHISAGRTVPASLNFIPDVFPPMTKTSPLGKITPLWNLRAKCIESMGVIIGELPLISMIIALLVLCRLLPEIAPPATSIFPFSYITVIPCLGYQSCSSGPTCLIEPKF